MVFFWAIPGSELETTIVDCTGNFCNLLRNSFCFSYNKTIIRNY